MSEYPALFGAVGYAWGGSGESFNLPDLEGRFLRGADNGKERDPDVDNREPCAKGGNSKGVGSRQGDATARPNSSFTTNSTGSHSHSITGADYDGTESKFVRGQTSYGSVSTSSAGNHSHSVTGGGDSETRPINAAVNWIIKY